MSNVSSMLFKMVVDRVAQWVCAIARVACIVQRMAALLTRRVCAAWWTSVGLVPPVRQQLTDEGATREPSKGPARSQTLSMHGNSLTLPLESVPHSRVTNWLAWVEPQASLARTAPG